MMDNPLGYKENSSGSPAYVIVKLGLSSASSQSYDTSYVYNARTHTHSEEVIPAVKSILMPNDKTKCRTKNIVSAINRDLFFRNIIENIFTEGQKELKTVSQIHPKSIPNRVNVSSLHTI